MCKLPNRPLLGPLASDFNPEASSYFARAGVTNPSAKESINAVVDGLKTNSLWDDLGAFWIGRSAYNAGTGNTVYDLKTDANNGTLSGAGWSTEGLIFANTQYMSSAYMHNTSVNTNNWSAYVVFKVTGDTSVNGRILGSAAGATSTMLFLVDANKANTRFGIYDTNQAFDGFVGANCTVFIRIAIRCIPSLGGGGPLVSWYQNGNSTAYTAISSSVTGANYPLYLNHPDSLAGHGTKTISVACMYQGIQLTPEQLSTLDGIVNTNLLAGL